MSRTRSRIAVIGAGVVGLSVAAELGRRGHEVVVLEAGTVGSGTSSTSYAWINSNGKSPREYYDLNLRGLALMHEQGGGSDWFVGSGHLEWPVDAAHARDLETRVARLESYGYPVEWLDSAEARRRAPVLRMPDDQRVAFFPSEGYVHPALLLVELFRRCGRAGVEVRERTPVAAIEPQGEGAIVRTTDGASLEVDTVVSCVGRWTEQLTGMLGSPVPMVSTAEVGGAGVGYLAVTTPVPVDFAPLLSHTGLNVRPAGGGRFLLQSTVLDADADSARRYGLDSEVATTLRDRFRALFRHAGGAEIESFVVGQRAMPADGWPAVGRLAPDSPLYVVATHSGVTLSLALGDWVAREIDGEEQEALRTFRPARLLDPAARFAAPVPRLPGQQ
ncbi:FAD-binding oxidoreductase [Rathayibacter sp. VKM Ac-2835]|uniref:NAD(P)/FAD-dependent oxidoreductase n=1 Tax=Rathayibacter sp. VKM Ac-2835 TaxID=2739043 RepID=UPI001566A3E9|nr:FAD-dependent oxidoreductase [Rathayibacter sp. VKM Ac-2835]NRG39347.1 FAD-binding oxidoreductase [Rathayibacter sp. VKM Ac-2835]